MGKTVARTQFVVTSDGIRIPVNRVENIRDAVESTIQNAYLAPYDGPELEHMGKTKLQVGAEKVASQVADGNADEFHRALDRLIGKPTQHNENLNVQTNLKDFLNGVARDNGIIDVEGTPAPEPTPEPNHDRNHDYDHEDIL